MNEAKAGCVLRLFGAPDAAVGAAVGQFPPQWKAAAQWKSRGPKRWWPSRRRARRG